jgi:hypothetical protein
VRDFEKYSKKKKGRLVMGPVASTPVNMMYSTNPEAIIEIKETTSC